MYKKQWDTMYVSCMCHLVIIQWNSRVKGGLAELTEIMCQHFSEKKTHFRRRESFYLEGCEGHSIPGLWDSFFQ
jgi:hypothetical protein